MIGKIVNFQENADHLAAKWCREHNLAGKVVGEEAGLLQIDVGLYYQIYAKPDQVQLISDTGEVKPLNPDLQSKAPIPDDYEY